MNKENMPCSWDDVSLGQMVRLEKLKDLEIDSDTEFRYLAVLLDATLDEVLNLPIQVTQEGLKKMQFILKQPRKRLVKKFYELNGKRYVACLKYDEITTAQYIDYTNMSNDIKNNIEKVMSIFLIPEGHKYNDGYDMQEVYADILTMSVTDATSLSAFFFVRWQLYTALTIRLTLKAMRKAVRAGAMSRTEFRKAKKEGMELYRLLFLG